MALVVPVTLGLAATYDDTFFRQHWHTPKLLTPTTVAVMALGAILFAFGGLWPTLLRPTSPSRAWPSLEDHRLPRLRAACSLVFRLTMIGYAAYGLAGLARGARPADLLVAISQQDNYDSPLRTYFAPVTGVTTLTQLGIAYVVLGLISLTIAWHPATVRRLALVLLLALARTYFLSERLAVLELAVPAATVIGFTLARRAGPKVRLLTQLAPLLLVPAVVGIFGAFEYSRSWVFYARHGDRNFAAFVVDRLAGYYCTAYNNGQLLMDAAKGHKSLPYQTIEAFWTAPGVSQLNLYHRLTGLTEPENSATLLAQYANPEFNSPGGLSMPFVDYGLVGGLVFFLVVGSLLGLMYREFCEGQLWAVFAYPVFVTGLFEMPRYLYWGTGRVLPALLALLITSRWVARPGSARARLTRTEAVS